MALSTIPAPLGNDVVGTSELLPSRPPAGAVALDHAVRVAGERADVALFLVLAALAFTTKWLFLLAIGLKLARSSPPLTRSA